MIKAVIIDDEIAGIENLKTLLARYCPEIKVCAQTENPLQAKEIIDSCSPELVFLDIEMPFGNGIDLLAEYDEIPFEVIFVTAFEKYAIQAIHLSACDYILKPVEITELINAVGKAAKRITLNTQNAGLKAFLSNLRATNKDRKIALPTLNGMIFIKVADVIRCEADGGYTWFHFTNREKLLITKNLGEYENLLAGKDFIRVHHAHLINVQHIVELKRANSPLVTLTDGSSITVSQRKRDLILEYVHTLPG